MFGVLNYSFYLFSFYYYYKLKCLKVKDFHKKKIKIANEKQNKEKKMKEYIIGILTLTNCCERWIAQSTVNTNSVKRAMVEFSVCFETVFSFCLCSKNVFLV